MPEAEVEKQMGTTCNCKPLHKVENYEVCTHDLPPATMPLQGSIELTWYATPWGRITEFDLTNGLQAKTIIQDFLNKQYTLAEAKNRIVGWDNQATAEADGFIREEGHKMIFVHWASDTCIAGAHMWTFLCGDDWILELVLILCLIGFLCQLSASLSNCQRWTEYGDINCQKFSGWFSAVMVCASAWSAWGIWGHYVEQIKGEMTIPMAGAAYTELTVGEWVITNSLLYTFLLVIGCIKIYDILVHCLVATPVGRHTKWNEGNKPEEMDEYMLRFQDANIGALPYSARHKF